MSEPDQQAVHAQDRERVDPEERIRPHLDQGVLKRLPLSHGARRATPLHLIVKRDLAPIDEQVATLLALFRTP